MKKLSILSLLLVGFAVSGCGSDSGGGEDTPVPAPQSQMDFNGFVKGLIAQSDDEAEPASVNDRSFQMSDEDNEEVFDDLLQ